RVLDALARGRPGVGADDLSRAVDGLAGHLGADEVAALRVVAEMMAAYQHRDVAALTAMPARVGERGPRPPADPPCGAAFAAPPRWAGSPARPVSRARGQASPAPPRFGGSMPAAIQDALGLLVSGEVVPPKVVNRLRRDAVMLDLS